MNDAVDPTRHQQQPLKIGRLGSIQVMRAVAVIFVLALHMSSQAVVASGQADFWKKAAALTNAFGHSGVDLFFVISGAVMYLVAARGDGPNLPRKAADFLSRRAFRIFPVFWASLVFSAITSTQRRNISFEELYRGFFLIDYPAFHPVAWTLIIEIRFYLIVAIILAVFSNLQRAFVAWSLITVICGIAWHLIVVTRGWDEFGSIVSANPELWLFTTPLLCEFAFGALAAIAILNYGKLVLRASSVLICVGLTALAISFAVVYQDPKLTLGGYRVVLFGLPMALIFAGVVAIEVYRGFKFPKLLIVFGDISYSLYLWHLPILVLVTSQLVWRIGPMPGAVYLAVCFPLIVAVSAGSYYLLERPLMRAADVASRVLGRRRVAMTEVTAYSYAITTPANPSPEVQRRSQPH